MGNKYKEALDWVFKELVINNATPKWDLGALGKRKEKLALNTALLQELVDKETPLKTIHYISNEGYETHLCGRCKSQVSLYGQGSYCEICGQKIEFDLKLTDYEELPKNEKIIVLGIRSDE